MIGRALLPVAYSTATVQHEAPKQHDEAQHRVQQETQHEAEAQHIYKAQDNKEQPEEATSLSVGLWS